MVHDALVVRRMLKAKNVQDFMNLGCRMTAVANAETRRLFRIARFCEACKAKKFNRCFFDDMSLCFGYLRKPCGVLTDSFCGCDDAFFAVNINFFFITIIQQCAANDNVWVVRHFCKLKWSSFLYFSNCRTEAACLIELTLLVNECECDWQMIPAERRCFLCSGFYRWLFIRFNSFKMESIRCFCYSIVLEHNATIMNIADNFRRSEERRVGKEV